MNNKFGRDRRYRDAGYRYEDSRRDRDAREPFWRGFEEEQVWRSPDQEFETSGPYRQPREPVLRREDARSRYEGVYAPAYSPEWGTERYGWTSENRGGYSGRGPKDYTRTDERIREDVCERLSWDDEVDATDVSVRVQNGEVTLEGTVETRHMKRRAEDLADDVSGVVDVHNTIRVKKPMLTELKEKLTGESSEHHYANTGTKTTGASSAGARNGVT
jgi:hypothetical protein